MLIKLAYIIIDHLIDLSLYLNANGIIKRITST